MSSILRLYPYFVIVAAIAVLLAATLWIRARRKSPGQRERERRLRISEIGRITDGTVIDVTQMTANDAGESQLLIFRYDVAGVSYEASQDITRLRHLVDLHSCRLGLPVSIRYDPVNPGDSIVVSENWTGLRS
jgi:hypothetical protein